MNIIFLSMVYFAQFLIAFIAMRKSDNIKDILLAVQTIGFTCLYGIRTCDIGHDTISYYIMYKEKDCFQTKYAVEPNFALLVSVLRKLAVNVEMFIWLLCFISVIFIALACRNFMHEDKKYMNCLFALVFCMPYTILMQVNVVRQGIENIYDELKGENKK